MLDPNLDWLKAVSETMARLKTTVDEYRGKGYSYRTVSVNLDDIDTIAADLLRLAENVEKAYHEGYDQGVTGQPRRKRLTPASAEKEEG